MLELNPQCRLGRSLGRGLLPPAQSDAAPAPADTTVLGATALGQGGEGGGCGGRTRAGAGEGVCREYSGTRRAWAPTPALPRSSRVASGEGLTPPGPSALGAKSAHRPTPLSCGCREDQGGGRVALPRVAPLTGPPGSQLSPRADAHSVTQRGKDRTGGDGKRGRRRGEEVGARRRQESLGGPGSHLHLPGGGMPGVHPTRHAPLSSLPLLGPLPLNEHTHAHAHTASQE